MMRAGLLYLLAGLVLYALPTSAQEVAARLEADTSRIRIGESLTLRLQLSQPKGLDIPWPSWLDSLAGVELIHVSEVDTPETNDKNVLLRNQTVVVTSFDSGSIQLPAVQFSYARSDGRKILFETDPLSIEVFTVQVDTTRAFRDIKGNVDVPWDYRLIAIWVAGLALVAGLIYWLYKRFRTKSTTTPVIPPVVDIPPDIRALEELKLLDQERVWQSGDQKGYHTRLTDILRTYLFERYGINAPELTTDDLVGNSLVLSLPAAERENLERILRLADLVKFAKYDALPDECVWAMGVAVSFVTVTRPRTESTTPGMNQGVNGHVD